MYLFAKPGIARLMSGMARSSYGKSFIQFSKSDLRAMDIIFEICGNFS